MGEKPVKLEPAENAGGRELTPGTKLFHDQYTIENYLSHGGFGITYLARDSLQRLIVIKECFPDAICRRVNSTVRVRSRTHVETFRTILELFMDEAQSLARLSHPNIVGVHQIFEDNETAYIAMDFVEGHDLQELSEGSTPLEPAMMERLTVKLLGAIEYLHGQGILHRDIAPDNILVNKDNQPILIDFGAARGLAAQTADGLGLTRTVKDGYSPQEFYAKSDEQHESSDLYSLAASLYHVMSGTPPASAQQRLNAIATEQPDPLIPIEDLVEGYSDPFLAAIGLALNVFDKDRLPSARAWQEMLSQTPTDLAIKRAVAQSKVTSGSATIFGAKSKNETSIKQSSAAMAAALSRSFQAEKKSRSPLLLGGAVIALLAVLGFGAMSMFNAGDAPSAPPTATAAATPESSSAPAADTAAPSDMSSIFTRDADLVSQAPRTLTPDATGETPLVPSATRPTVSAPATVETATPPAAPQSDVIDVGDIVTRLAIQFPATGTSDDPAIVAEVDGALEGILVPGTKLLSVNGFPVNAVSDAERVLAATAELALGSAFVFNLGVENTATGETSVVAATLPVVSLTELPDGTAFQTWRAGNEWVTRVSASNGSEVSDLQPGDRVVALMPDSVMIDSADALPNFLRDSLNAGSGQVSFAVKRAEDLWVVTLRLTR